MITNKKERLTNQKRIILDYLKSTKCHPCAEEVYFFVQKKLPQISQGTVYRILNNLKEKGEILEILSGGKSRYDGDTSLHGHFFCQKCGRVFDVFEKCKILRCKKLKVGIVKNYQIYFYGICNKCKK